MLKQKIWVLFSLEERALKGKKNYPVLKQSNCHTTCDYVWWYSNMMWKLEKWAGTIENPDADVLEEGSKNTLKYGFKNINIEQAEQQFWFPFLCRIGIDYKKLAFSDREQNGDLILKNKHKISITDLHLRIMNFQMKEILERSQNNTIPKTADEFYQIHKEAIRWLYYETLTGNNDFKEMIHSFVVLWKNENGEYICFEQSGKWELFWISNIKYIMDSYPHNDLYFAPIKSKNNATTSTN